MPDTFDLPQHRPDLVDFLKTRRSNLAKLMRGPGPDAELRDQMLEIAARVPDHRKLAPWRFIVFEGEARDHVGTAICKAFKNRNPNAPADRAEFERARFLRAPLIVGVVSSPVICPRGTPQWEQQLSAGAACYNLCLAAQAHGFAAQWLTEWYAYDDDLRPTFGLDGEERMAGFIYIGLIDQPPTERARPDLSTKICHF